METSNADLKKRLENEKTLLIKELQKVGRINPDNTSDWEPVAAELNINNAEQEERAEEIQSFEERSAIEFELEKRLNEVDEALNKIESNAYGKCLVCNNEIENSRLQANPAATTCKTHME